MCRVAGLSETPGSWRSSSGKGEAGRETGGKRGAGRGAEIDLERQRGTYIERDPDREMGRKKQGNREPERDREEDRNRRACGGNGHTRSETEAYALRWGKREREEKGGEGGRGRERGRDGRLNVLWAIICTKQGWVKVKAMQWRGAGAESVPSGCPLLTLRSGQQLDAKRIRLNVDCKGSHETDKQERDSFLSSNDKLQRVVPLIPAPSYQLSWAPLWSPHFITWFLYPQPWHQTCMAQKLAEYVLVAISDCGTAFSLKAFPWHQIVLSSIQWTAEHLLCARQWTDTISFPKNFHFTGRGRLGHRHLYRRQSTRAQPDQPGPLLKECYVDKSLTNATVCRQTGVWKETSESKKRKGKDKEKKLAFTLGLGTIACYVIESTQSNLSRWPFYRHFFFFPLVDMKM